MSLFTYESISVKSIVIISTYIIGSLSLIAAIPYMDIPYTSCIIVMLLLSLYREYRKFSIPRAFLTIISCAVILFFFVILDVNNFVVQLIEVLLILLGIKFLESKAVRDFMQIYAIALLVLAALGLLIPTLIYALYILLFVTVLSLTLVFLTYYSEDTELVLSRKTARAILSRCAWIPLFAIPASMIIFFILPRSQFPFLSFLNRPDEARTGFTDVVRLGGVQNIQEDTGIIFRASCRKLAEQDVYWRGMTLDYFDGVAWRTSQNRHSDVSFLNPLKAAGPTVKQLIYLEPYQNTYYFGLDKPLDVSLRRVRKFSDLTITAPFPIGRRVRYEVTSLLSDTIRQETVDRARYLQTPASLSPKIVSLAKTITRNGNPEETIGRLLRYLNDGQYTYSLRGLPVTGKPLETFLFESRRGNCEYFASTLALLLRISNIPSRLVGGYRGGYYNDVGGYYIVPQSHAHVWVEAFVEGKGWLRLDPTPAAPDGSLKRNAFTELRVIFDTINYFWNTVVINYSLEQQISLSRHFVRAFDSPYTFRLHRLRGTVWYFIWCIAGICTLLWITMFVLRRKKSREQYIAVRFLRTLERSGYRKKPGQGLEEFVSCIVDEQLKERALTFVHEFEKFYYTDTPIESSDMVVLKSMLKEIGRSTAPDVSSGEGHHYR